MKLLPILGAILNLGVKESSVKVGMAGTVKKLTLENMGIAFGIFL